MHDTLDGQMLMRILGDQKEVLAGLGAVGWSITIILQYIARWIKLQQVHYSTLQMVTE